MSATAFWTNPPFWIALHLLAVALVLGGTLLVGHGLHLVTAACPRGARQEGIRLLTVVVVVVLLLRGLQQTPGLAGALCRWGGHLGLGTTC